MSTTLRDQPNKQTGEERRTSADIRHRHEHVQYGGTTSSETREPDRTCILKNLKDCISDEHRVGVDDGTMALQDHGTMRAPRPSQRAIKTAGRDCLDDTTATALQPSRIVRWRIKERNERKEDVPIIGEHIYTAPLPPRSSFEAVLMSRVSCGTSLESNLDLAHRCLTESKVAQQRRGKLPTAPGRKEL
jgi:hypothetical protein